MPKEEQKSIIIPLIPDDNSLENTEVIDEISITATEEIENITSEKSKKKESNKSKKTEKKSDAKSKKSSKKKDKIKETKTEETPKETSNTKNRNKNDEYYIQIQYPSENADGEFIKVIPEDNKNFQHSKELYHQLKEEYKHEALEISLIGTAKNHEPYTLHSKKLEQKNSQEIIKSHLKEMINLKESILNQFNDLKDEISELEQQKDSIEAIIKNTDYNIKEKNSSLPNELIRLKHILRKLDNSKTTLKLLEVLNNDTDVFKPLEELMSKLPS